MDTQKKSSVAAPAGPNNVTKRQQVDKANQMMFVWVAAAAVVVVTCAVLGIFLVRQAFFNGQIISQKSKTNGTIVKNIDSANKLKANIDLLLADSNLTAARGNTGDTNLKVIFDALPSSGDTTTLSNSIYTQVFQRSGVQVQSISAGTADASAAAQVPVVTAPLTGTTTAPSPQSVSFQGSVLGSSQSITNMFKNFEKVIRPMNILTISLQASDGDRLTVNLTGETYYLANDTVSKGTVTVKPKL